jgi:hypothetical protein
MNPQSKRADCYRPFDAQGTGDNTVSLPGLAEWGMGGYPEVVTSLTATEQYWLAWYRALNRIQLIAVRCYVNTGDIRLLLFIWDGLVDEPQQGAHLTFA